MEKNHNDQHDGAHQKRRKIGPAKHAEQEEEAGELWLVSYADMMTLLVGFFVILLSFSKVDEEKFEEVKKAAAKQFGGIYQVPFSDLANRIKETLEKQGLANEFVVKQTNLGVTVSFQGAVFFDTGSAEVKPQAKELLDKLVPVLKSQAGDFQVIVEGHTDDVAIYTPFFKSNWELSGTRASRVLEAFQNNGFLKTQLTAVGYADARPVVPNLDANGVPNEVNRSQNRRVVIKVIKPSETLIQGEGSTADVSMSTERSN